MAQPSRSAYLSRVWLQTSTGSVCRPAHAPPQTTPAPTTDAVGAGGRRARVSRLGLGGLGREGAEELAERGAAEVAGLLHDPGGLGVGSERRPALLVPVEDRPDPVLLGRVAV